jgi:hypothetical protein
MLQGQGQVSTRKHRIADFTDKVTQVVLTGNEMLSSALREEVVAGWTASAFEFCPLERYESIKDKEEYYFLIIADAGDISFLTLHKGAYEVISLPLSAAMGGDGRELTYLSALIKTIQDYTLEAMESERVAYGMEAWVNRNYDKWGHTKQIRIAREDLAECVTEQDLDKYLDTEFLIAADTAEADQEYHSAQYNTLVGYVVAPLVPEKDSYCYKMLFEADTHVLYYLSKHKITAKKGVGFLPEDLKRLAKKR